MNCCVLNKRVSGKSLGRKSKNLSVSLLNISTKKSLLSPTPINKNDWVQFYYRVPCPFFIQSNSIASSGLIKRNANIHKQGRKKINEFSDKKTSGKSILKQNFPGKKKGVKLLLSKSLNIFFERT